MKTHSNTFPITFKEGQKDKMKVWNYRFENLESLRNYLKIKMIQRVSIRAFVSGLNKMVTLKSYIAPNDLTEENYNWLSEGGSDEEKFIMVNYRRG